MLHLPPTLRTGEFMGAGTAYGRPRSVLLGVPLDHTVYFRPGTRIAPSRIRPASYCLEEYSMHAGKTLRDIPFYDAGDLILPPGDVARSMELIKDSVEALVNTKQKPFLIGAEHLLTYPAVMACLNFYPDLALLQLDAHADLLSSFAGVRYSDASVMRCLVEDGLKDLYQVGIRSAMEEEVAFAREHTHFYPFTLLESLEKVVSILKDRPVYVTFDIDVVDPAYAPGTSSPEPGGCSAFEAFQAMEIIKDLNVVAFDLVEVSPPFDHGEITSLLASKILREALLHFG